MKRFIKTGLLYLLCLIAFYPICIVLWEIFIPSPFKPNLIYNPHTSFLSNRLTDVKEVSDVDILFLGSSKAYRGFDPRIFNEKGYKTFNLGSGAQTHIQTNYLIKEYLDQLNPDLVIYEVYPDTFTGDGVESAINVISAANSISINLMELVWDMNDIKTYNTFLNKTTRKTLKFPPRINENSNGEDTYIRGGYVEHLTSFDTIITLPYSRWIPNDEQIRKFEENLTILKKNKIPFILVLTPLTKKFENLDEIENFFKARGEFLNLNKTLDFSIQEDFYDGQHLNQDAVKKLNTELIKIIELNQDIF